MTRILPLALVAMLAFAGCSPSAGEVSVKDVTKSETVILRQMHGQGPVSGMLIRGTGEITGEAEIQLMLNSSVYKRERLSGPVKFQWEGDWYSDAAEIRYVVGSASGGTLTLTYQFH